jgi:hypothetical protein
MCGCRSHWQLQTAKKQKAQLGRRRVLIMDHGGTSAVSFGLSFNWKAGTLVMARVPGCQLRNLREGTEGML